MEEWHMEWISRERGKQAGVPYAEDYYFLDEFRSSARTRKITCATKYKNNESA